MNMQQQRNRDQRDDSNCNDCTETEYEYPIKKTLKSERQTICNTLYNTSATVGEMEEKFKGEKHVYHTRQCMFVWTETNYKLYRNLEITSGTELLQTNDSIKANVKNYVGLNKDLNSQLLKIANGIKNVKAKFGDLKEAACKLDWCLKDSCSVQQRKALTGHLPENCKDGPKNLPKECCDAEDILKEMIDYPTTLFGDLESIFKSSFDVVGIQMFSNIDTLDGMQKELETKSKDFESYIKTTMTTRLTDLNSRQSELIQSVKDLTKAAMDRNSTRADFEGYRDTIEFLCHPHCHKCINYDDSDKNEDDCGCGKHGSGRLKECEKQICCICEDVKKTFCCENCDEPKKDC